LKEENEASEEPSGIFLERNLRLMYKIKQKEKIKPIATNGLCFKFDYASKKMNFLKSSSDFLINSSRKDMAEEEKFKTLFKRNLKFRLWLQTKV
jgi:hypothetical protein